METSMKVAYNTLQDVKNALEHEVISPATPEGRRAITVAIGRMDEAWATEKATLLRLRRLGRDAETDLRNGTKVATQVYDENGIYVGWKVEVAPV